MILFLYFRFLAHRTLVRKREDKYASVYLSPYSLRASPLCGGATRSLSFFEIKRSQSNLRSLADKRACRLTSLDYQPKISALNSFAPRFCVIKNGGNALKTCRGRGSTYRQKQPKENSGSCPSVRVIIPKVGDPSIPIEPGLKI